MSRQPLLGDRSRSLGADYDPRASSGIRSSTFNLAPQNIACTSVSYRRKRPKRVSHYLLGPILGEGSYGVVRDAIDSASLQRVAVKCIKKGFRNNPNATRIEQQLVAEVDYLQRFHHPNVIRARDIFCSAQGKDYMVLPVAVCSLQQLIDVREEELNKNFSTPGMSFGGYGSQTPTIDATHSTNSQRSPSSSQRMEGSFAFSRKKLVPTALARDIMYQILSGVDYMHNQHLHHNDLKPENVLLFADGTVKITDLGCVGKVFIGRGTPAYLSPEATCVKDDLEVVAAANDCWACGVLLFLLMTNRLPFQGYNTELALFQAIIEQPIDFSLVEEEGARSLVEGLLQKDQTKRMTSSQALRHPWLQNANVPSTFKTQPEITENPENALRGEISHHNVRRIFNIKDMAEMIQLDEARHRQFCHEIRFILDIQPTTKESRREMEDLRPAFLPETELNYYSRKGQPENDVRSFRQDALKLSGIAQYCSKQIEGDKKPDAAAPPQKKSKSKETCCLGCQVS